MGTASVSDRITDVTTGLPRAGVKIHIALYPDLVAWDSSGNQVTARTFETDGAGNWTALLPRTDQLTPAGDWTYRIIESLNSPADGLPPLLRSYEIDVPGDGPYTASARWRSSPGSPPPQITPATFGGAAGDGISIAGTLISVTKPLRATAPAAALTTLPVVLSGNEITDAVRTAALTGDGVTPPDSSLGIWGPTTPMATILTAYGLMTDGNAAYGLEGVNAAGTFWIGAGVMPTRVTTQHKFGGTAYACTTPGSVNLEGYYFGEYTVTSGHRYSVGLWVWGPSGTIRVGIGDSGIGSTSATVTLDGTYHYVRLSLLTTGASSTFRVNITTLGTQAITFYAGGVTVLGPDEPIAKPYAGPYGRAGGRVQLPTTVFSVSNFAVVIRGNHGYPSTQAGATNPVWWQYQQDSTHYVHLLYNMSAGQWELQRRDGATTSTVVLADTFTLGQDKTIVCDGTPTTIRIAVAGVNGNAWVSLANTALPTMTTPTFDLGSITGTAQWLNGNLRWAVLYGSALGTADPTTIAGWTNTAPSWAQVSGLSVGATVTLGRWSAANPHALAVQPVNDLSASALQVAGLGIGAQPHAGAGLTVTPAATGDAGIVVRAPSNQTGNLFEAWSGGQLATVVNSAGQVVAPIYPVDGPQVALKAFWRSGDPDWYNALQRLQAYAQGKGGLVVTHEPGLFNVAVPILGNDFGPALTQLRSPVCFFRGLAGVALLMPNSTFVDTTTYTNGGHDLFGDYGLLFVFEGCQNVTAAVNVQSQVDGTSLDTHGAYGNIAGLMCFTFLNACQRYAVSSTITGAAKAVRACAVDKGGNLTGGGAIAPRDGLIDLICSQVHYPLNNEWGGDRTTAKLVNDRCGRNFQLYGCKQQRLAVTSLNQRVESLLQATSGKGLDDVELYYYDHSPSTITPHESGTDAQLFLGWVADAAPAGTHRNIRLRLDIDASSSGYGDLLAIAKQHVNATGQTAGVGATLDGLDLQGVLIGNGTGRCINSTATDAGSFYGQFVTTGTPDSVRRVHVHDLWASGGSAGALLDFGGAASTDEVHIDDVQEAVGLTYGNANAGLAALTRVTAPNLTGPGAIASQKIRYEDCGPDLVARFASVYSGRRSEAQGASVASANNLALGHDGNYFQISGTTQINLLAATDWQGGSLVTLKFNGILTVKHNQTASGANKPIFLKAAADLTTAAGTTLVLRYDATDATWYQV